MSTYALADKTAQWFADDYPGATMDPNCGTLHTTESPGWPAYGGGKSAPNYTARPDFTAKRLRWRAHFPDEMSSRALENDPGGVDTNTANNLQVELVGTCDPKHRASWHGLGVQLAGVHYLFWPDAPDWALTEVARFLVDAHKRHAIPLRGPTLWNPYPKSYGTAGGQRMTFTQWRQFTGWCGHQHVPENDHGDPGALRFARILQLAQQLLNPTEEPDMDATQAKQLAETHAMLTRLSEQAPRRYMAPDPDDPKKRRWVQVAAGEPGAVVVPLLDGLGGNALQNNIHTARDEIAAAVIDVDALAAAVVAKLPATAVSPKDLAAELIRQLAAQ